MEDFKCYVAQLKPFELDGREGEKLIHFQKQSIKYGVCGMGYKKKKDSYFNSRNEYFLSEEYNKYRNHINGNNSFVSVLNRYSEMKIGDYIFTRLYASGVCYIGKIASKAYHSSTKYNFDYYENYTWIVDVEWKEVGHFSKLPNSLRGLLKQSRQPAIKRVLGNQSKVIHMIYTEKYLQKIPFSYCDFHEVLDSDDLEDLVYMYMKKNNSDYYLLPSSCKTSEPLIEFVMVNEKNERITCQVKSNNEIDFQAYKDLSETYSRIYLFSGKKVINKDKTENIIVIEREDLFNFFKCEFKKENSHFHSMLSKYYKIDE